MMESISFPFDRGLKQYLRVPNLDREENGLEFIYFQLDFGSIWFIRPCTDLAVYGNSYPYPKTLFILIGSICYTLDNTIVGQFILKSLLQRKPV